MRNLFYKTICLTLAMLWLIPLGAKAAAEIEVSMDRTTAAHISISDDTLTVPVELGKTIPDATLTRTFTVKNVGDASLIVSALETSLLSFNNTTNHTGFTLGSTFPTSVIEPGANFTFTLRFDPKAVKPTALGAGGSSITTVSFSTNDSDESPFNFSIQANVVDPSTSDLQLLEGTLDDVVTGTAVKIPHGATSSAGNAPSFGSTVIGQPVTKTFTMMNAGGADLRINPPITVTNVNGSQAFTVDALGEPTTVTALGGSISFKVTLTATQAGEFSAPGVNDPETVAFNYQDAGNPLAKTFNFEVEGIVGPVPDVAVLDGTTNISKDGEINLGTQKVNANGMTKTITIKNEGGANLLLENPISISGEQFSLVSENFAKTTLAPGSTTEVNVKFDTTTPGYFTGAVTFKSNDSDETPFVLNLSGVVASTLTESEIEIWQIAEGGNKTQINHAQTQAIETKVPVNGVAPVLTFEVRNTGGKDLQLTSLTFNDKEFQLTTPFPKNISAGGSDIFGIQLKNTATQGTYTNKLQIFNTDGKSGDGSVENPFSFTMKAIVGEATGDTLIGNCFEQQNGVFSGDQCTKASSLLSSAVDKTGKAIATNSFILGGISKAGETYLQESTVSLNDKIATRGVIKVDVEDQGQKVDIIVAAIHYLDQYPEGFAWYMLDGCSTCVKLWPYDKRSAGPLLSELRPLKTITALESYVVADMYSGNFLYPGFLDIFFGYRTTTGKIVFNTLPINVTILAPR